MKHAWTTVRSYVPGEPDEIDAVCKNCGVSWDGENMNYECEPSEAVLILETAAA